MSDLYARLRDVIATGRPAPAAAPTVTATGSDAPRALGGVFTETALGRCLVVDRDHRMSDRHGDVSLAEFGCADAACASVARLLAGSFGRDEAARPLLFVDLETTGLAGGAGTHAFLIGCGWFDAGAFHTRQFFLDRLRDEPALLDCAGERLRDAAIIASFNGKTFDLPLIETRYVFHRRAFPCADTPHLDLLHPSRRLWRGPEGCSLSALEHQLFGVARHGDIPGFEIPARYFAYVRGASASTLAPVLAHNRSDLLSLAMIALYAGRLIEGGADAARGAEECFGLGRLYEWLGDPAAALACYERAARLTWRSATRRLHAMRAMARLYRRDRRHEDAVLAWQAIADGSDDPMLTDEAATALAVHHEHRSKKLDVARRFAAIALQSPSERRREAAQYRLARIQRKLARHSQPVNQLEF